MGSSNKRVATLQAWCVSAVAVLTFVGGCAGDGTPPDGDSAGDGGEGDAPPSGGASSGGSLAGRGGDDDAGTAGSVGPAGGGNVPWTPGGGGQGGSATNVPGGEAGAGGAPGGAGAGGAPSEAGAGGDGTAVPVTWLGQCSPLGLSNDGKTALAEHGVWTSQTGWVAPPDLEGGDVQSSVRSLSADGKVVFGSSSSALGNELYRWSVDGGTIEPLGVTHVPLATNLDGTVLLALPSEGTPVRWTEAGGFEELANSLNSTMSFAYMEAQLSEAGDLGYFTQDRTIWRWTLADGLEPFEYHYRITALTGDGRKPARLFLMGLWTSIQATGTCLQGGDLLSYMAPPEVCEEEETVVVTDFDATGKRAVGIEYSDGLPWHQFYWSEARGMRKLHDVLPLASNVATDHPPTTDTLGGELRHGPFVSADGLTVLAQARSGECFLASVEDRAPLNPEEYQHGDGPEPPTTDLGPFQWLGFCGPIGISDDGKALLSTNGLWTEGYGWHGFSEIPTNVSDLRQNPAALSGDGKVVYGSTHDAQLYRWTEAAGLQLLGQSGYALATNSDGSVMVGVSGGVPFSYTSGGGFTKLKAAVGAGALPWDAQSPFHAQLSAAGDLAYFSSATSYARWDLGDSTFKVLSTSQVATALSADGQVLKLIGATGDDVSSTGTCLQNPGAPTPCVGSRVALLGLDASGTRGVGNEWINSELKHSFFWSLQGGMQELDELVPQNQGIDVYPGEYLDYWDPGASIPQVHPQLSRDGKRLFARTEYGVCFLLDLVE